MLDLVIGFLLGQIGFIVSSITICDNRDPLSFCLHSMYMVIVSSDLTYHPLLEETAVRLDVDGLHNPPCCVTDFAIRTGWDQSGQNCFRFPSSMMTMCAKVVRPREKVHPFGR